MASTNVMENFVNNHPYTYSEVQKNNFKENSYHLFNDLMSSYHYDPTETGLNSIWDVYTKNKSNVAAIFSNHPNWVDDQMLIHLKEDFHREIDSKAINKFIVFLKKVVDKKIIESEVKVYNMSHNQLVNWYMDTYDLVRKLKELNDPDIVYKGRGLDWYTNQLKEIEDAIKSFKLMKHEMIYLNNNYWNNFIVTKEDKIKFDAINEMINLIWAIDTTTIEDKAIVNRFNSLAEVIAPIDKKGKKVKFNAQVGQKMTRIVTKFFTWAGFTDYKEIETTTWTDQSGNEHTRTKNIGWDYQYAMYADAITPLNVKRHTYISLNPIDYWTMSFGNGWASCHTIDKRDTRNGSSNYHGCYSSGTESYMLDPTTVIMYTTKEEINTDAPWFEDKVNRCVFNIGKDKIIQGRVYPDGRDGGSSTISTEMRAIMQKVIAECLNVNNSWKLVKGTSKPNELVYSEGTHYRDYLHYGDATVSFIKVNGCTDNNEMITIGHNPICPHCGTQHTGEEFITCRDCRNGANRNVA